MTNEYKQHLKEKSDWHKSNMSTVAEYFKCICQKCNQSTSEKQGVIHHFQYTGNDYKKAFEKLVSDNAITWFCKKCHREEHTAFCVSEVDFKIKHSGYCAICEKFEWHAWFKLGNKSNYVKQSAPLCNKCVQNLMKIGFLKEKIVEFNNEKREKIIIFSQSYNIEAKILKPILEKLNKTSFGKKGKEKDKNNQMGLF